MGPIFEFFKTLGFLEYLILELHGWKNGCDWNMRVNELFSVSGLWDMHRLEQVATMQEVEAILSIPIAQSTCRDKLIWNQNKQGKFSVKSAYWLAKSNRSTPIASVYWKHLWKLKVPPKMNHFLWRCSMGFIPCMWSLYQRYIVQSPLCPRCQAADDAPLHATWSCSFCVAVLERVSFYSKLVSGMLTDFSELLNHAFKVLTVDEMKLLVIILWSNWSERNRVIHGERPRPPSIIYDQCGLMWDSLLAVQDSMQSHLSSGGSTIGMAWQPPSPGMLSLNTDASVINNGVNIGVGVVVRNHLGDLVLTGGERVQGRFRPSVAELLALCKGLEYVVEHNWLLEKVECDCLEAVRVVNDVGECFAEEGILVDRVRALLVAVGSPKFSHVSRTANGAADVVAKYVARLNGRLVWLGVGPDWLMDVIVSDRPVTVSGSREMSGETSSSTDNSHVL
ncbi:hypothetical protein ACLB2K_014179 [Fragaria x ananassa]